MRQSVRNYLIQNVIIRSSKTNVLSVWKEHFSVFCKLLSDEVETISWESEAKRSKLFNSKFGHKELLRKWFWSILKLDTKIVCVWKGYFSVFYKFLSDEVETVFWEIEAKRLKLFNSKFSHRKLKNDCTEGLKII